MNYLSLSIQGKPVLTPDNIPSTSAQTLVNFIISLLVGVGFVLGIIFLLYAGIQWITSGGDKERVEKARSILTYSIIGLIIIVFTLVIMSLFGQLLGIKLF